jgi:oligopeptide/dipeptide ABC transporter ATP-binding protein
MTAPVLSIDNVAKRFGTKAAPLWALAGVSITVERGETLGIVGESGCGKSTLARIAVGLETPTSGTVQLFHDGKPLARSRGQAQMVFQDPASSLNPLIRLTKSVGEPLEVSPNRSPTRAARVREMLAAVGLGSEAAGRFPRALSGGQKQRASIARALSGLPPLVVCDEAVTALDVSIRSQVLNLLRALQAESGTSFVFISHDLCTVGYMSDRIAVMYLGKIMEIGPAAKILSSPGQPYTQALLSAVPRLQQGRFKRAAIRLSGEPPSPTQRFSGCRFQKRCPLATERCRQEEPGLDPLDGNHRVACHYAPVSEARMWAAHAGGGQAA